MKNKIFGAIMLLAITALIASSPSLRKAQDQKPAPFGEAGVGHEATTNSVMRNPPPLLRSFGEFEWLDGNTAKQFNLPQIFAASKIEKEKSRDGKPILSKADAIQYLNSHLNMAVPSSVGYEDSLHYYFSGGLNTSQVKDFSSGLILNKTTGELRRWGL